MRSHQPDDWVANEAWEEAWEEAGESAPELNGADGCVARLGHEHAEAICPRTSQCHCARPIGHPIPVAGPDPREKATSRNSSATASPTRRFGMDRDTLEQLRRTLLGRRASLLKRWRQALADENELLAEREPDWEDHAAAATAASILDSIGERGRRALARIQSSLVRIERGSYDECAACHGPIDAERLRAVPDTDRCGRCATEN